MLHISTIAVTEITYVAFANVNVIELIRDFSMINCKKRVLKSYY